MSSAYFNKSFVGGALFGAGVTMLIGGLTVWSIGRKLVRNNRLDKRDSPQTTSLSIYTIDKKDSAISTIPVAITDLPSLPTQEIKDVDRMVSEESSSNYEKEVVESNALDID